MTSLYYHISWFIFFSSLTFISFIFSIYMSYLITSYYFSINLFSFWFLDINVSFYFDLISCWFTTTVLLITTVIIIYSYFYIRPYSKTNYFLWLTILFVLSILLVINISDIFFVILGWDGLGLISFFLIVYYQNQSSITSGLFTLLINRIGDSFFLVSIVIYFYFSPNTFSFRSETISTFYLFFILVTFITKRALYPFSPWLPLAIAAPTPISALVHSSTLVTSGLFLIIRFSYIFYSSILLIKLLLILRIFTSFYAGMNAIVEKDLKKLIALSTLRHLGFIGLSFSCGFLYLAFFHLLTHALFKSLLFITIGDIIINLSHSQDIRYLSIGVKYTPFSCFIIYVSLLNLLGLPRLSGFFSKDLVLETVNYNYFSFILTIILFINVFFTYYYTYQLFFYSFQSNKLSPYLNFHRPILTHTILLFLIRVFTLLFGYFYLRLINPFVLFVSVNFVNKILPLVINFIVFISLFLNAKLFRFINKKTSYYFSNIIFLSNIIMRFSSNIFYVFNFNIVKSLELGFINYSINNYFSTIFSFIQTVFLNLRITQPLKLLFISIFLVIFIVILL